MEYDKNELEELLILYALGELEPEEATAVEEEIRKRPELAAQVEKARSVDGLLTDVFAQSVEPVPEVIAEESEKPIVANKVEKPQGRLAQRLAFSVAALALVLVVGALIYPQLVSKDAQVAMTSPDDVKDSSVSTRPEVKNVRLASPAPSTPDSPALPEDESVAINDAEDVVPPEAVAEDANTGIADVAMEEDANILPASATPDLENVHPVLPANNTFADDSSPKTAGGVMPFKGISSVDQERPEASLGEMAVDQMNKRLDSQQREKTTEKAVDAAAADMDSYAQLRKCVLEENQFPKPNCVNIEQWLKHFGVSESENTTADNKDAQFAKAVTQYGKLLLKGETTNVDAYDEVLNMLKDSVGNDEKRIEFKSIVEKTVMLSIMERTDGLNEMFLD